MENVWCNSSCCMGCWKSDSKVGLELEMFTDKMKGEELIMSKGHKREEVSLSLGRTRRLLSGPGSSPPRCASKCGKCTPCKPVHVPVPPGTPVTAEYYPEAWRCKCGNKLYMP
ncbi:hypothetical protein HYC85_031592 [Camellia sinensis]|uniref:Epidermal patterning factor-like protein n=1 Tax=Camellia sinensis TaxID=4442 RepID=A0A7J7FR70_CAMSI|nr:hypothetical protein HYC85_031592 [Camellia sinensis]